MTGARRQANFKSRNVKSGSAARLDVIVSVSAAAALNRLAGYYGISKQAAVERLLLEAQKHLVESLPDAECSRFIALSQHSPPAPRSRRHRGEGGG